MRHRRLWRASTVALLALVCASVGRVGAETAAKPTPKLQARLASTAVRLVPKARSFAITVPQPARPTQALIDVLPWRAAEKTNPADMLKVTRLVPASQRAALDRPVADARYRARIAETGAAFRIGARRVPVQVDPNAIVDIGASSPLEARSMAAVNLKESPALDQEIRNQLGVNPAQEYVSATLADELLVDVAASRAGRATKYRHASTLYVSVVPKSKGQASLWRVEGTQWKNVYAQIPLAQAKRTGKAVATSLGQLQSQKAQRYFGGSELVDFTVNQAQLNALTPVSFPAIAATPVSGELTIVNTTGSSLSSSSCSILGSSGLISPSSAPSTSDLVLTNCSPAVPQSSGSTPTTQSATGGASGTGGTAATGGSTQPPGYVAYGAPWVEPLTLCGHQCSAQWCAELCCLPIYWVQLAAVAAFAGACHAAAFIFVPAHIYCAIQEAVLVSAATSMVTMCVKGCTYSYWTTVYDNPKGCHVSQP
ncbi:MAG: hypothetical protein JW940_33985 [Polyangiaceae bacterium]|nr:hypothetical protein [Polyangiaceae bacterium]